MIVTGFASLKVEPLTSVISTLVTLPPSGPTIALMASTNPDSILASSLISVQLEFTFSLIAA